MTWGSNSQMGHGQRAGSPPPAPSSEYPSSLSQWQGAMSPPPLSIPVYSKCLFPSCIPHPFTSRASVPAVACAGSSAIPLPCSLPSRVSRVPHRRGKILHGGKYPPPPEPFWLVLADVHVAEIRQTWEQGKGEPAGRTSSPEKPPACSGVREPGWMPRLTSP